MKEILISVVLPTYNGEKYLKESIESIIKQTYTNWELFIVNDCSTDQTKEIANYYASQDKRIQLINNETNQKLPKSLNIGFSYANGEYFTWTSDDNMYKPNAFKIMLDFLLKNPDLDLVYCDYTKQIIKNDKIIREEMVSVNDTMATFVVSSSCACFLYTATVAKKLGGYNENLFLTEDYEYFLRLGLENNGVAQGKAALHQNLYIYRHHDSNLTSTKTEEINFRNWETINNILPLYLAKYPSLWDSLPLKTKLEYTSGMDKSKLQYAIENLKKQKTKFQIFRMLRRYYSYSGNTLYLEEMKKLKFAYFIQTIRNFFQKIKL